MVFSSTWSAFLIVFLICFICYCFGGSQFRISVSFPFHNIFCWLVSSTIVYSFNYALPPVRMKRTQRKKEAVNFILVDPLTTKTFRIFQSVKISYFTLCCLGYIIFRFFFLCRYFYVSLFFSGSNRFCIIFVVFLHWVCFTFSVFVVQMEFNTNNASTIFENSLNATCGVQKTSIETPNQRVTSNLRIENGQQSKRNKWKAW